MRKLFESPRLPAGGSIRFELLSEDALRGHSGLGYGPAEGFAVRATGGAVRAYVNQCPHRASPVDLGDGKLYAKDGLLECQAHGAYFDPGSGRCLRGPCEGESLTPLDTEEREGAVWLLEGPEPRVDD